MEQNLDEGGNVTPIANSALGEWLYHSFFTPNAKFVLKDRYRIGVATSVDVTHKWSDMSADIKAIIADSNVLIDELVRGLQQDAMMSLGIEIARKCPELLQSFVDSGIRKGFLPPQISTLEFRRHASMDEPNEQPDWLDA